MSHSKERAEKICLNCKTELQGYYCHVCGQENREPRDTVWGLVTHFFYDITHFDGKFFSTISLLLRKPGFLSREYMQGRRASYLNPIRLYVFTSAVFFLIFFTAMNTEKLNVANRKLEIPVHVVVSDTLRAQALAMAASQRDSVMLEKVLSLIPGDTIPAKKPVESIADNSTQAIEFDWGGSDRYTSVADYEAAQKLLPARERDSWLRGKLIRQTIYLRQKYNGNSQELTKALLDKFIHSLPSLLFVSLPLYALFLMLLYIRRKQFYYVDHGLFLIHLYVFTFIFLLICYGFYFLREKYDWSWVDIPIGILIGYGIYYAYKAMRNFYQQSRRKTIAKFVLFNLMALASILFLFGLFFTISLLRL